MQLVWKISARDARRIEAFVRERRRHPFVQLRIKRNIRKERPPVNIDRFWHAMWVGLLTTQQKSGPGSSVRRFLRQKPFALTHRRCARTDSPEDLIRSTLTDFRGIRMADTIAERATENLCYLDEGGWKETLPQLRRLEGKHKLVTERRVAAHLASAFVGLGPKQSRNVLQFMGLTRHEIPLDSRMTKWLNVFGFPLNLSANALSDPSYYEFVSDGVQALCKRAGVYPCILDAAVFSSFDEED